MTTPTSTTSTTTLQTDYEELFKQVKMYQNTKNLIGTMIENFVIHVRSNQKLENDQKIYLMSDIQYILKNYGELIKSEMETLSMETYYFPDMFFQQ